MKRKSLRFLLLPLALVLCSGRVANANLVTNPGFESGDFAGWTQSGDTTFTGVVGPYLTAPHSGLFQAVFGPIDSLGFLSQSISTMGGSSYDLSFWLYNPGDTPNAFQVSWDGTTIYATSNEAAFGYTQFTFNGLLATGTSTTLEFAFYHPPSFWHFDDVSVNAAAAVPEGGSAIMLLGIGILGLVAVRRKLATT